MRTQGKLTISWGCLMVRGVMISLGVFALVMLVLSFFTLKNVFELVNNSTAYLRIKDCTIKGIKLLFKARINVRSALDYTIELAQLKITDTSGDYIDSWSGEVKNKEDFLISFSNAELFNGRFDKVIIDGFVKVKFDIGKSGFKVNLPVKVEVSFVGREE